MDLIIIRHGETEENSRGIVHGHSEGTLSTLGLKQAKDLAFKLKHENITAIYSSDFQRCRETAEFIHTYHKNVPLMLKPELREMHGGALNKGGFSPKLVIKGIQLLKLFHVKTPGGESWKELSARVSNFLNEVYEKHSDDTVILVTHGITMQAIRLQIEGSNGRKFKLQQVPNCSVWRMTMKNKV